MIEEKVPCYGCEDRVIACHSTCIKYKGWQAKHEELLRQVYESKALYNALDELSVNGYRNRKKKPLRKNRRR